MEKDINVTRPHITLVTRVKEYALTHRIQAIIGVLVLVVLLFFTWKAFGQGTAKPQYQTAQAQTGSIISSVNESGNVASGSQAGVGSPTTGILEEIYVKDGDTVTQGQNLFKVKSTATAQEIASTLATYQSALAQADTAQQNKLTAQATLEKDRAAVLDAQDAVDQMTGVIGGSKNNPKTGSPYNQNEINSVNSALTSARETFTADEKKYTQADQSIAASQASENSAYLAYQATQDSVVTAPVDGTVANIAVQQGDEITASSGNLSSELNASGGSSSGGSSNTNTPVLYIGNYSSPYIKVQASEVDIAKVQPGQKATVTLNAFPTQTFVGTVSQVDSSGTVSSGVVTYNVFVNLISPPSTIKPGMSATVTIETARKDNVLTVPSGAVQTTNGQSYVRVLQNGKITQVPVTTGITSDTDTEITSGLSAGDTVVTGVTSTSTQGSSGSSPFSGGLRGFGGGGGFGGGAGGRGGGGGARGG